MLVYGLFNDIRRSSLPTTVATPTLKLYVPNLVATSCIKEALFFRTTTVGARRLLNIPLDKAVSSFIGENCTIYLSLKLKSNTRGSLSSILFTDVKGLKALFLIS